MLNNNSAKLTIFKLIIFLLTPVFTLICVEILFTTYYYFRDGTYFPVQQMLAQEGGNFQRDLTQGDCNFSDTLFPHPYLGWVHHANPPCGLPNINSIGFYGQAFPWKRREDKFVVLLTGGSVASQLGRLTQGSLQELLNQNYSEYGKRFVVLNGAIEAWKQPQQLILFAMYANLVDAVVTLDGYNEFFMPRVPTNSGRLEIPWKLSFDVVNRFSASSNTAVAATWFNGQVYRLTRDNWIISHSKSLYFLSQLLRRHVASYVENDSSMNDTSLTSIDGIFAFPKQWDDRTRKRWNLEQYANYIRMINGIAYRMKVPAIHFLQPVPAIGKALTKEEKMVVGDISYASEYNEMVQQLLQLRDEGIVVFSLLELYKDYTGSLYYDNVHQRLDSEGYRLMAARIAKILGEQWNLAQH